MMTNAAVSSLVPTTVRTHKEAIRVPVPQATISQPTEKYAKVLLTLTI